MRSQPHGGHVCVHLCVCVCVYVCSLPVGYMDECEHYMCQQTGDSTAFINKNKKEFSSSSAEEGLEKGAHGKMGGIGFTDRPECSILTRL